MTPAAILGVSADIGLGLLSLAILFTVVRIVRGPTLADRILGLDLITTLGIGFVGVIAIKTGFTLYVDIAIALGIVGFLSTIALARYLLRQAETRAEGEVVE
jgi:multicomponent Na+:H+ antiporter subunit F